MRIASALFAPLVSARLAGAGLTVPRHVLRTFLLVLRLAEAAVRWFFIISAQALEQVTAAAQRPSADAGRVFAAFQSKSATLVPVLQLIDPLKAFPSPDGKDDDGLDGAAGMSGATPVFDPQN